ncbi:MAG: type II secretion system protein [Patescibacteria group bacterium]
MLKILRENGKTTRRFSGKSVGFTLVELLVVVAIIGLLAALVLNNTGSTRDRAKNNAIISSLNSLRSGGELWINASGSYTGFCADNDCGTGGSDWKRVCAAIKAQNNNPTVTCNVSPTAWCVYTSLVGGGNHCVDSVNKSASSTCSGTSCI